MKTDIIDTNYISENINVVQNVLRNMVNLPNILKWSRKNLRIRINHLNHIQHIYHFWISHTFTKYSSLFKNWHICFK